MAEKSEKKLGWFNTPGRLGDRDLATQMEGLAKLVAEVPGKTVLDAGAAEGLISIELAKAGAKSCLGLEVVASHVEVGNELAAAANVPCEFVVSNLNEDDITAMAEMFDVVLMLACLHKLKQPAKVCADLAGRCRDLCVIRLPPSGLKIVDLRSENVLQDIGKTMDAAGFDLEVQGRGPFDEWIGYFRRRAGTLPPEPETEAAIPETVVVETETNAPDVETDRHVKPMSLTEANVFVSAHHRYQKKFAESMVDLDVAMKVLGENQSAVASPAETQESVHRAIEAALEKTEWSETPYEDAGVISDSLSRPLPSQEPQAQSEPEPDAAKDADQPRTRRTRRTGKGE